MVRQHLEELDWLIPFVVAMASLVISGYNGYTSNEKELAQRISVVETQQRNDTGRTERIEMKVDRILDKMMGW